MVVALVKNNNNGGTHRNNNSVQGNTTSRLSIWSKNNSVTTTRKRKILVVVFCAIPVLFFLSQTVRLTNKYNAFLKSAEELEAWASVSSLWMPSTSDNATQSDTTSSSSSSSSQPMTTTTNQQKSSVIEGSNSKNDNKKNVAAAKKDYSDPSRYWRYDEAAPPVQYAKVHQVQSLPAEYRLGSLAFENFTEYLLQPQNQYPQKTHIFEINPSITTLPPKYRVPLSLSTVDNNNINNNINNINSKDNIPLYLASYRITDSHNCGRQGKTLMYGGGNYTKSLEVIGTTNYLGLAFLNQDLTILADVVLILNSTSLIPRFKKSMMDFRLFTLHDELYLSTSVFLGQLQLGHHRLLPPPQAPQAVVTTTTAAASAGSSTTTRQEESSTSSLFFQVDHVDTTRQFSVFLSKTFLCTYFFSRQESGAKNLLYFLDNNDTIMTEFLLPSSSSSTTITHNDVRSIDYSNKKCRYIKESSSINNNNHNYKTEEKTSSASGFVPTFHNFHEQRFPKPRLALLMADRGSACCVRMEDPWSQQEYLVGVSHPKTHYPGKSLPKGVKPNLYFSRFFAMEAVPPYTIVARTGAFCFGYPKTEEVENFTTLWHRKGEDALVMAQDTFDCPRIHFVMSMIDNVVDDSQVIISYGVNDCNSRFVTVNKVDIQAMLWPRAPAG